MKQERSSCIGAESKAKYIYKRFIAIRKHIKTEKKIKKINVVNAIRRIKIMLSIVEYLW